MVGPYTFYITGSIWSLLGVAVSFWSLRRPVLVAALALVPQAVSLRNLWRGRAGGSLLPLTAACVSAHFRIKHGVEKS